MKNLVFIAVYILTFSCICKNNLYAQRDSHDFDVSDAETISGVVIIDGIVPYAVAGEFVNEDTASFPIPFWYVPGAFMISKADYQRLCSFGKDDGLRIILRTSESKLKHSVKKDFFETSEITYSTEVWAGFIQYGNFILNIRNFRRQHGKDYYFDIYTPSGVRAIPTNLSKAKWKKVKSVMTPYYVTKFRNGKLKHNRFKKTYR